MKIAVIFESIYGNTGAIAAAIAAGLEDHGDVTLYRVEEADIDADLLVFGAPTHAHGLPSRASRAGIEAEARKQLAAGEELDYQPTAGIRKLVSELPRSAGARVACFDTRLDKSAVLTGSAAKTMAKKLRQLGYRRIAEPESFFVLDVDGPLKEGELERAKVWGATIGAAIMVKR
jgi:Flavodoxin